MPLDEKTVRVDLIQPDGTIKSYDKFYINRVSTQDPCTGARIHYLMITTHSEAGP